MIGIMLVDGSFSGTIQQMMKKVGLKLKTIVTSISSDKESVSKPTEKVIGCLYNPVDDKL